MYEDETCTNRETSLVGKERERSLRSRTKYSVNLSQRKSLEDIECIEGQIKLSRSHRIVSLTSSKLVNGVRYHY